MSISSTENDYSSYEYTLKFSFGTHSASKEIKVTLKEECSSTGLQADMEIDKHALIGQTSQILSQQQLIDLVKIDATEKASCFTFLMKDDSCNADILSNSHVHTKLKANYIDDGNVSITLPDPVPVVISTVCMVV